MNSSLIEIKKVSKELPVFTTNLSNYKDILELAIEGIFDLKKSNPVSIKSNVEAEYVSSWVSHIETPKLNPLCDLVLSFCNEVSKKYWNSDIQYKVFNCWGMIYEGGNFTKKHNHFPSVFAAVVYIDVDEKSAPIILEDSLTLEPTSGTLVVFPALINHEVPVTNSKRIVVAMNIDYKSG